jgi:hypothetical protein
MLGAPSGPLKELNRCSLDVTLNNVYQNLDLKMGEPERRRLAKIRNHLVHHAGFLAEDSEMSQFRFLVTEIGRLLLAILSWRGRFHDWVGDPNRPAEMEYLRDPISSRL